MLHRSRHSIGHNLSKGTIVVTFFEKRESKALFGLLSHSDKVCFERWRIPVVVNEPSLSAPRKSGDDSPTLQNAIIEMARTQVQQQILAILEVIFKKGSS